MVKVGLNDAICSNTMPCYPDTSSIFGCQFNSNGVSGKCGCDPNNAYIWNESTMSCSDCKQGYLKKGSICGINLLIVQVLSISLN